MTEEKERKHHGGVVGRLPVIRRFRNLGNPQRSPWREIYLVALMLIAIGVTVYAVVLLAQDRVDTLLAVIAIVANSIVLFRNAAAFRKRERRGKRSRRVTPMDVGATLIVGLLTVGIVSAFADVEPFSGMKDGLVESFSDGEEEPPGEELPTLVPTVPPTLAPTLPPSPEATSIPPLPTLSAHFIDVGQGESILLDVGDTEVLIDGGDRSPGVVSYLKEHVDGRLEVLVATSPHSDHIGGLIAVLDVFDVEQIWVNGDTATSETYEEFMERVKGEDADMRVGRRGDVIAVGDLKLAVLHPVELMANNANNNSIVLLLAYGEVDFLFMSYAEEEAEAAMLVSAVMPVPDVEVLKVGYHGSRTASSRDFLALTSPEVAIYMAADGNMYGYPHQETMIALKEIGAAVYGTDINGDIVVTTDGQTYTVVTQR